MTFNILQVRAATDPTDPFYPTVQQNGKTFSVATVPADGRSIKNYQGIDVAVWEVGADGKYHQIGSFGGDGARFQFFVTDRRVIVLSHQFKGHGDSTDLLFGFTGMYVAGTLLNKLRERNRALTGHIPLVCIDQVSALGVGDRRHANKVRVSLIEKTDGAARRVMLQITLPMGTDPRPLAQDIAHRTARRWVMSVNAAPALKALGSAAAWGKVADIAEAPLLETNTKQYVAYNLPVHFSVSAETFKKIGWQ